MNCTQTLAVVLYSVAAVLAVWGPGIALVRIYRKYRATDDERLGTWDDPALDPVEVRKAARADAWWGVAEFGFVAAGVILASIASIILVLPR